MRYTAGELFGLLNEQDECTWIEAKGGSESSHSVMETICAYSNEPGLGGGYILMGVAVDQITLSPQYKVIGVSDPDKFQRDFATQCAGMFNFPIRPEVYVEKLNNKTIIKIWVDELPQRQKPVYFKSDGLPTGALRRIGSTDQHCTEDDMPVFYQDSTSFDQSPVKGVSLNDIDENAIKRYRALREKVNPTAEELTYDDAELLQALGCVNKERQGELNIAGLLLFGTSKAQRSSVPMLRVDYIRVPGNTWVENPNNRFTTIDMLGPLILILYRLIDAINADLPKGFLLTEHDIQAESTGLPMNALREAIVNALMHRSYREHRPTQIIRYDNRIEIINPGFSLKSTDKLGQPGSETRNPFIAAVFHDTNLAETKGSGIRAMRRLMQEAHMVPPTFESRRVENEFVSRLLLHHFLDEKDLQWLGQFEQLHLNDAQKQALIFVREVGAIDNQTYRQMADCDALRASNELRYLKTSKLLNAKKSGKATYYIAGDIILAPEADKGSALSIEGGALSIEGGALSIGGGALSIGSANNVSDSAINVGGSAINVETLIELLPENLITKIRNLSVRENDSAKIKEIIKEICTIRPYKRIEIAAILKKSEKHISRNYLKPMLGNNELRYLHPEMIHHPEQAYLTNNKN